MDIMEIIDITVPLENNIVVWPGDPEVEIDWLEQLSEGGEANITRFSMGAHTGTHIDAPLHFLQTGSDLDQIDLKYLIGECLVVDVPESIKIIDEYFLEKINFRCVERILFKSKNSSINKERKFNQEYVSLDQGGAKFLVENGAKLVGIDYLSIAPYADSGPTHTALLNAGIIILEGLDLGKVTAGLYHLICLPIKLSGREGAPARAILIKP